MDGDGYIGISGCHAQFKLVGQGWLLADFAKLVAPLGVSLRVRPHKSIYVVGTSCGGAEKIVSYLYADAPVGLTRKMNAAMNIRDTEPGAGRAVAARGDRVKSARSVKREPQRTHPSKVA